MKRKNLVKRVIAGTAICGLLGMSVCSASTFTANAAPATAAGSHPNKNSSIIPGKEKKNNGKKVNQENDSKKNWNQKMIQALATEQTEKTVRVAIIDSGVNYSSDIEVAVRKNFIEEDECSILYEDASGHGTAIAGLIAALDNEEGITGINPRVEIYSARVLDDKLEAPIDRIVAAIDWAIEQKCDILNMSFGIPENILELEQAIDRADAAGILMIAAVGNGEKVAYPAAYDEVIAVGAVTTEGNPSANSANGTELELMAPGENLVASGIFDGVLGVSGTSFAVPHVTGAASVLWEMNPEMPADYIRALLDYSANLYGDQSEYGNGVLDISYALEINDKFKKAYNKHIDKAEKQKEKQKNKFWGEVIKTIPENEKAVETFTGIEVVEGLWEGTGHDGLTQYAIDNTSVSFSADQLEILIAGCKYPDKSESGMSNMEINPYHGFFRHKISEGGWIESNYLANYIYLTRIANHSGSLSGVATVSGISTTDKTIIDGHFQTNMVGIISYKQAFDLMGIRGNTETKSANLSNRKLFVYGIAIHVIEDTYAHSTFRFDGTKYVFNNHTNFHCDEPNNYPNRYNAAKEAMKHVVVHAYNNSDGMLQDYGISIGYYGTTNENRFYLNRLVPYAQEVDSALYSQWAQYYSYYYTSFNYGSIDAGLSLQLIIGAVFGKRIIM